MRSWLLVLRCTVSLVLLFQMWRVCLTLSGPKAIRQSFQHHCPDNLLDEQLPDSNELVKQSIVFVIAVTINKLKF